MKNILTLFTSNADFITQCRTACKLTIENTNTGWWLKQTLDRLEKAEAEITKLKAENELLRLGWCRESEKRQQDWFDPSKGPTCDQERFI